MLIFILFGATTLLPSRPEQVHFRDDSVCSLKSGLGLGGGLDHLGWEQGLSLHSPMVVADKGAASRNRLVFLKSGRSPGFEDAVTGKCFLLWLICSGFKKIFLGFG